MKKRIVIITIISILIIMGITSVLLYNYTELFGKKLLSLKINSITIQYIPEIDLKSVETINKETQSTLEVQEIKLSKEEIKNLQKEFNKIKKIKKEKISDEIYVEILIDKKSTLFIGNKKSYIKENNSISKISIPTNLFNKIYNIIEKNNKKIQKRIELKEAIIKNDQATITISNENNKKTLKEKLIYYPINLDIDYNTYQNGYKYELIINNNIEIYLYEGYEGKIAYIIDKSEEETKNYYAIFPKNTYTTIQKIYETSNN